jgi:hypothetical protein
MSTIVRRRGKSDVLYVETMGGHQIPIYRVELSDGCFYDVPKHIRRVSDAKSALNGWQISFNRLDTGYFSKYFPDANSTQIALERATRELRRFLRDTSTTRRARLRIREDKKKIHKTGIAGIRLYWRLGRRTSTHELRVEVRAGAVYSAHTAKSIFAGTEFSVTEESLKKAMMEGLDFRRQKLSDAAARGDTFPKIRGKRPKIIVDFPKVFETLKEMKMRSGSVIEEHVQQKVASRLASKRRFMMFRNRPIKWESKVVNGQTVKIPDFIELKDREWLFEYRLPNRCLYGGSIGLSLDPASDIEEIVTECFTESLMATIEAPVESLYETLPRYTRMPLAAIEAINQRAG